MRRRVGQSDLGFESDSFLDIIANIVGILIILIVVAGMRVSNAPILPALEMKAAAASEDDDVQQQKPPELAVVGPSESLDAENPVLPTLEPVIPETEAPQEPSPQLLGLVTSLQQEVAALDEQTAHTDQQLLQLQFNERQSQQQLAAAAAAFSAETSALKKQKHKTGLLQAKLEKSRGEVRKLRLRLAKAEREKQPTQIIRHKLTPISRVVEGQEAHFHLARNRVALIPLDDMIDRLRAQVARQRDWLIKFPRHQGSIGPVRGFTMNYVVERQQLSVVEELRQGRGIMRIGISEWQLETAPDLSAESAEQALRPGSAFHRALLAIDPQTTLTFWVYPDSFELFRELKQLAHEEDFTVAARPLPFGIPISASPYGTRSAGQ